MKDRLEGPQAQAEPWGVVLRRAPLSLLVATFFGVGFLRDQTGGYTIPFTMTALLTYAAAVAILFVRPAKALQPAMNLDEGAATPKA